MRRPTQMNESCHTYERVVPHTWMSHVSHTHAIHPHRSQLVGCESISLTPKHYRHPSPFLQPPPLHPNILGDLFKDTGQIAGVNARCREFAKSCRHCHHTVCMFYGLTHLHACKQQPSEAVVCGGACARTHALTYTHTYSCTIALNPCDGHAAAKGL